MEELSLLNTQPKAISPFICSGGTGVVEWISSASPQANLSLGWNEAAGSVGFSGVCSFLGFSSMSSGFCTYAAYHHPEHAHRASTSYPSPRVAWFTPSRLCCLCASKSIVSEGHGGFSHRQSCTVSLPKRSKPVKSRQFPEQYEPQPTVATAIIQVTRVE